YDLFGMEAWSDEPTPPSGLYLQQPPQYCPAQPALPIARVQFAQEAASCPAGSCPSAACPQCHDSACTQCSATEAAKAEMHVSIDGSGDRKCVEISAGKSRFKASADRLAMHGHCIVLEGDVRAESCEDAGCGMVIKADKLCVEHKDGGLTIRVDGAGAINAD